MKVFFLFILFIISSSIYSQTVSGKIVDHVTKDAVPYVNIGIVAKGVGTVSQFDGSFSLELNSENIHDTIVFSCLGFQKLKIPVSDLLIPEKSNLIEMQSIAIELKNVVILPKKTGTDLLGNTYDSKNITGRFQTEKLGCEVGTLMKVKQKKTYYLNQVKINLTTVSYDSIIFRLNIYTTQNDLPTTLLNTQPIFVTVYRNQQSIIVNLKKYNLSTDVDFVVALEWIQDVEGSHNMVGFCAGFGGASTFFKDTSLDEWQKAPSIIGLGISCIADFEKEKK